MALFIYLKINLQIIAVQKKKKEETPDLYFSDQTRFD